MNDQRENILSRVKSRSGIIKNQPPPFDVHLTEYVKESNKIKLDMTKFSHFIDSIYSNDPNVQHYGLLGLRKSLSVSIKFFFYSY